MNGIKYLLDTNIIIGLYARNPVTLNLLKTKQVKTHDCAYSAITRMELLSYPAITASDKDWYSRNVLSWRVSNSLDASFCIDALEEAICHYGTSAIFNTDQGSQYTCEAFTEELKDHGIDISMDGKGAWRDNVFVERLWCNVKYEEVYLNVYESTSEARQSLTKYFRFYNENREYQTLMATPDQVYYESIKLPKAG